MKDLDLYIEEWTKTQLIIWKEVIEKMKIVRSGNLHQSFKSAIEEAAGGTSIEMTFVRYGIYQALGTGRGYVDSQHGNYGNLKFLDKEYRHKNRLDVPRKVGPKWGGYKTSGKPRKRRDWMSKKLFMSLMSMREDLARITGEMGAQMICNALSDIRNAVR